MMNSPSSETAIQRLALSANLPGLIWAADQQGRIIYLKGDAPRAILGFTQKTTGPSLLESFAASPELLAGLRSALDGKPYHIVTHPGNETWEWWFYPLQDDSYPQAMVGLALNLGSEERGWFNQALLSTEKALRNTTHQSHMPEVIINCLVNQLGIDQAALVLGSSPGRSYRLKYSWGAWDQISGKDPSLEELFTDPKIIHDLTYRERNPVSNAERIRELSRIRGFPMIAQDEVQGALWISRGEPFTQMEERLVQEIAGMAASAFQRSSQLEITEKALDRLSALHAIDRAISGSFNLNLTLHIILEQVVAQLDVDAADIFLVDPDSFKATYAEGRGFLHYQPETGISQIREDLVWQVLRRRELVAIPQVTETHPDLIEERTFSMEGFQSYYGIPLIAKGKILGVLEVFLREPQEVDNEWFDFLRTLGTQAAIAMDNASLVEDLRRTNLKLDQAYDITLETWVRVLSMRDESSGSNHLEIVEKTLMLAQAMGVSRTKLIHIKRGALLHDIGKLIVPDSILKKVDPLTEDEWDVIRKHPGYAVDILEPIDFLKPALPIPSAHHEKWDGSGYPLGISGEQIPLEARVFAVIDVWDALGSSRPYREAWPEDKIFSYIREQANAHFDPRVIQTWERVFQIPR